MLVVTKTFRMLTNLEGWSPTVDTGSILGYHKLPRLITRKNNPPLSNVVFGSMVTIARAGTDASANYWELTTTWEALGVPSGKLVGTISADYLYRWNMREARTTVSIAQFNDTSTVSGPLELLNSGNTLISTLSPVHPSITRNNFTGLWAGFPEGGALDPILANPPSWATAVSGNMGIPDAYMSSNSVIKFRLHNTLPETVSRTAGSAPTFVRIKQARISITMFYDDAPIPGTQGASLGFFA